MEKEFFCRKADVVAYDLLGCEIIRFVDGEELRGKIVETEAYFDENDPASRASQNGDLRDTMMMEPGTILVYGVHNNWLVNFVTDKKGKASAVLVRAIEPLNFEGRGNGPGILSKSLKIDKRLHKKRIGEELRVKIRKKKALIGQSFRIGVKKDLNKPMRFFIIGNKHVSRK
jgi:DNA-3-methyladenine glycosylase